jgi:hypothetical protein
MGSCRVVEQEELMPTATRTRRRHLGTRTTARHAPRTPPGHRALRPDRGRLQRRQPQPTGVKKVSKRATGALSARNSKLGAAAAAGAAAIVLHKRQGHDDDDGVASSGP